MNNDLTGTQGSSSRFPTGTDSTVTTPLPGTTTAKATSVNGVYDGTDIMSDMSATFVAQIFPPRMKSIYDTSSDRPQPLPPDPDGEVGPQPVGTAEQKLIMRFFYKRVRELLGKSGLSAEEVKTAYNAITSGIPLSEPKFQNIVNQAKKETQEKTPLPQNWDPKSTNPQDWIKQPLQPYNKEKQNEINQYYDKAVKEALNRYVAEAKPPLTENQIQQLQKAISEGKVSTEIFDQFQSITKTARKETQETYGLSETWYKETPNTDDWKPINLSPLAPAALNQAQGEQIFINLNEYLVSLDNAGKLVGESLDPGNANEISMDEFRKAISIAIRELKQILQEIQLKDSEISAGAIQSKLDAAAARLEKMLKQIEEKLEAEKKQKKANDVKLALQIVGPIVAALATIVGAALAIFTFGASTALIVAGIAVGIALTTYSIVDSATGSTSKLMEIVNKALENAFPDDPMAQKLIKALAVVVIVVLLIVVIVLSAGGAAGSIASSVAVQTAKEIAKQLAIQLIIMAVMTSNALPELLGEILKAAGVDEKSSKIAEIIMMAITMVTIMIAIGIGGKGIDNVNKIVTEGLNSAGRVVKEAAIRFVQAAKKAVDELAQNALEGLKALLAQLEKLARSLLTSARNFLNSAQTANIPNAAAILGSLKNAINSLKEAVKAIGEQLRQLSKIADLTADFREVFSTQFKNAVARANEAAKAISRAVDDAVEATKQAKDALAISAKNTFEETKASMKRVSDMISEKLPSLREVGGKIGDAANDIGEGFKVIKRELDNIPKMFKETMQLREGVKAGVSEEVLMSLRSQRLVHTQEALAGTQKALQLTNHGTNIIGGVTLGVIGIQISHLTEAAGDSAEAAAMIQALIDLLGKLLQSVQTGIDARSEFIISLQRAYNDFYEGLSQNTSKIFRTLQG